MCGRSGVVIVSISEHEPRRDAATSRFETRCDGDHEEAAAIEALRERDVAAVGDDGYKQRRLQATTATNDGD